MKKLLLIAVLAGVCASGAYAGTGTGSLDSDFSASADGSAFSVSADASARSASTPDNPLNAVKITFLSWATGSTKISYERALPSHHQSAELCASLICAGYDKYDNNPLGFTTRYAHKFFLAWNDERSLNGFYVRPELMWSRYTYDSHELPGTRKLANMGALLATAGVQWSWGHFLADAWFGGGPAIGTPNSETLYHHGFALWNYLGTRNENIAMSFSIRLGYCF